ncbi:hypothetical protein AB9P05_21905 [Roseivirga sp. BDSF3-8]|uniref:hypothetical protein n=1 Tax=Roseivirga sp. BDSF3-8 TaxID=3241598 RepID=UPI0035320A48
MAEENAGAQGVQDATKGAFQWWKEKSTIQPGDSFGQKVLKVIYKIGGVLAMIIFSPLLLLAFLIAFLVAL